MKMRKPLSLLLVLLLTASFFASAAAAASSCKETDCGAIAMPMQHQRAGAARLSADCCTGFAPTSCELGPRRQVELASFYISSARIHSYAHVVLSPVADRFDFSFSNRAVMWSADAGAPGRSSPIYLEKMTLIC